MVACIIVGNSELVPHYRTVGFFLLVQQTLAHTFRQASMLNSVLITLVIWGESKMWWFAHQASWVFLPCPFRNLSGVASHLN